MIVLRFCSVLLYIVLNKPYFLRPICRRSFLHPELRRETTPTNLDIAGVLFCGARKFEIEYMNGRAVLHFICAAVSHMHRCGVVV